MLEAIIIPDMHFKLEYKEVPLDNSQPIQATVEGELSQTTPVYLFASYLIYITLHLFEDNRNLTSFNDWLKNAEIIFSRKQLFS